MTTTISLSAAGLRNLECLPIERDFEFICDGRSYETFKLVACILSPKIANMLTNDPSKTSFDIGIPDPHHLFKIIMDIAYNHDYQITIENYLFIRKVGIILENQDMVKAASKRELSIPTTENALKLLEILNEYGESTEEVSRFIAEDLSAFITKTEFLNLSPQSYESIFTNEKFQFKSETYSQLKQVLENKPDFLPIFKEIIFKKFDELPQKDLRDFISYVTDDDFPNAAIVIKDAILKIRQQ